MLTVRDIIGKRYVREDFLFFWRHTGSAESCFSQWYPSPFVIDGVSYNCAEQYMMAMKAIKKLGLTYLGGSKLKSIIGLCDGMKSLEELDLSGWNLRGVKVNDKAGSYMFEGCKSLKKVYMYGSKDLSVKKIRQELNESFCLNAVIKHVVIAMAK